LCGNKNKVSTKKSKSEEFLEALKTELVCRRRYAMREQARQEISKYIAISYNYKRRHFKLGNLSPTAFAQQ